MIYGRCLMSQNHMSQNHVYLFNRFSHYRARRIWKRHENFVPLHCQNEGVETAVIKGKNCEN